MKEYPILDLGTPEAQKERRIDWEPRKSGQPERITPPQSGNRYLQWAIC